MNSFNPFDAYDKLQEVLATSQQRRLMQLSFPRGDAPEALMVPNSLEGTEALSKDFKFTVEILSDDPRIELKDVLGKLVCVALIRSDGSSRYFTGHVFAFAFTGTEGGFARYRMELGPWLRFLTQRFDNHIFHHKTVSEQTQLIFEHLGALRDWKILPLKGGDPPMTDAVCFGETSYNYLHRRWEALGWSYGYEHTQEGHTLVLTDNTRQAQPIDGDGTVLYQIETGAMDADVISRLVPSRQVASTEVALASFDFKQPHPKHLGVPTVNKQGEAVPTLEISEYTGTYGFKDRADGDKQARLRMEEIEAWAKGFVGEGNNPYLQPNRWFELKNEYTSDAIDKVEDREFLITRVTHTITNNYEQQGQGASYQNSFECLRKKIPWRPGRNYNSQNTQILHPQTATVVGPEGQEVHTDEYGRVRVQFHWDREGSNDERSSAWIRVGSNWAGNRYGGMALPRIGQEVIVEFLDGCPDRPLITGRVYNQEQMPPWNLPGQHALMGFKSKELHSAGFNQFILDDSPEQIQVQLSSTHQTSQMSLGYITRIPNSEGRKDFRGEGFELRTDAWGAVRAGAGLFITTDERTGAQSTQRDMDEALQQLKEAEAQMEAINKVAEKATAIVADFERQEAFLEQRIKDLEQAVILISAPAGIALSTPADIQFSAGENLYHTAGGSYDTAVMKQYTLSTGEGISQFTQAEGIKQIASKGDIVVQANTDNIEVTAARDVKIASSSSEVVVTASKRILLACDGAYVQLTEDGNIEMGCPGVIKYKCADFEQVEPTTLSRERPVLPESSLLYEKPQQVAHFVLADDAAGLRLPKQRYRVTLDDGRIIEGQTNEHGETEPIYSNSWQMALVEILRETGETLGAYSRMILAPANRPVERPAPPIPARQMGDDTLELNTPDPTSEQRQPLPLSMTPFNFGMRRSVANHPKLDGYDAKHPGPDRFEVARTYTQKIKAALKALDWSETGPFVAKNPDGTPKMAQDAESLTPKLVPVAKWPLDDEEEKILFTAVRPFLYEALQQDAPYGLKAGGVTAGGAMPQIDFGTYKGKGPNVGGFFQAKTWGLYFTQITMQRLMVRDKDKALSALADVFYHEARHCQQFFWVLVMAMKPPASLRTLKMLSTHWVDADDVPTHERLIPKKIIQLAAATPLPTETHARIAIERLTVSWYYWGLDDWVKEGRETYGTVRTRQPGWLVELEDELARCKTVADRILMNAGHNGRSIDVTQLAGNYRLRPWEEDAFFVGDVVQSYWHDGRSPLHPLPVANGQSRGGNNG